jgi:hypothetical protein
VISTAIEIDEWIASWFKMRESTASAPSGHYGHYKIAAVIAKLPDDHKDYLPDLAENYADAKSCYDRIIKTLAMTACVAVGLPFAAAIMHNLTRNSMKHRMKSRDVFFRAYFGTDDDGLECSGQGSGASPSIWLIYSVSLLAAFSSFSPGMKLLSSYDTLLIVSVLADLLPDLLDAAEKSAQS